jgi:hypothetical protein
MRTENSCDSLPRWLPHPGHPFTLERQESVPGNPSGIPVYMRMEESGRFHDATLVRIRQLDRTGGAALPVADEKGRDRRLWCEFFHLAFPSRVRDVCGPRGSSEYTQRAGVSGGVRQLR